MDPTLVLSLHPSQTSGWLWSQPAAPTTRRVRPGPHAALTLAPSLPGAPLAPRGPAGPGGLAHHARRKPLSPWKGKDRVCDGGSRKAQVQGISVMQEEALLTLAPEGAGGHQGLQEHPEGAKETVSKTHLGLPH